MALKLRETVFFLFLIVAAIPKANAAAVALGATCTGAGDTCADPNAFCSTTCQCKSGYTAYGGTCVANGAVGADCLADSKCTLSTSVCESPACKVKAGEACNAASYCVLNSACSTTCTCSNGYFTGLTGLCTTAAAGTTCKADSSCADATLVCESTICKIKAGQTCPSGSTNCVSRSTCATSTSGMACTCNTGYTALTTGLCIVNGAVGADCLADSKCTLSTSVCESSACKVKAGQACTAVADCVLNSDCSKTCTCNNGYFTGLTGLCTTAAAGTTCKADSSCADTTLVCESTICKIKAGQTCPSGSTNCVSRSTCATSTSGMACTCNTGYTAPTTGLCIAKGDVGGACLAGSACTASTSLCESSVCKIKAGQTCPSGSTNCVSRSTCATSTSGMACTCNTGYTALNTGLCNGVAPQSVSSWLLTGSIITCLVTVCLL